jgi:plasmid stability protein
MAELLIKIPDEDLARLELQAKSHAVSVDEEALVILIKGIVPQPKPRKQLLEDIARFRDSFPPLPAGFDIDAAKREGRE